MMPRSISDCAERPKGRPFHLAAACIGGEMPGVGYCCGAVVAEAKNEAGGKGVLAATEHSLIHGSEDFCWTQRVVCKGANGADE